MMVTSWHRQRGMSFDVKRFKSQICRKVRNLRTALHSGCISFHSHQKCTRVLFSPHPCQHLLSVFFMMAVILTSVWWYLIVVLICISLIISDVEHLFMTCWPSAFPLWKKCLFISFAHFLAWSFDWLFGFLMLSCVAVYIFWTLTPYHIYHLQVFSPVS